MEVVTAAINPLFLQLPSLLIPPPHTEIKPKKFLCAGGGGLESSVHMNFKKYIKKRIMTVHIICFCPCTQEQMLGADIRLQGES